MGLNLATSGIGSFVGGILVQIIHSASKQYSPYGDWYADDINKGRLDLFFYVLAGLMGVNLLAFCMISVRYEYVSPDMLHQSEEEWQAAVRSTTKHWNSDEEEHYTNSPHGIAQED